MSSAWSDMPSQPNNNRLFSKGRVPTTTRLLSLIFVICKFNTSSEVNEKRHSNPSAVIELQLCKLSLVNRVSVVEIARSPSSLILVLLKSNISSEVNDERQSNPSPVIELELYKLSLVSRVNEIEIAKRPCSVMLVEPTSKSSSEVNDERHTNPLAGIDWQLPK